MIISYIIIDDMKHNVQSTKTWCYASACIGPTRRDTVPAHKGQEESDLASRYDSIDLGLHNEQGPVVNHMDAGRREEVGMGDPRKVAQSVGVAPCLSTQFGCASDSSHQERYHTRRFRQGDLDCALEVVRHGSLHRHSIDDR